MIWSSQMADMDATGNARAATSRALQLAVVEPDDTLWDAWTQRHPQGHLLQSARWGALKARFGWEPRRLAIAGAEGLIAGAQVLFRRRLGLSGEYVPRGPLFAGDDTADALLLAALDRLARRNRAVFLRLEPNLLESSPAMDRLHSMLLLRGFQTSTPLQPHSSIHLDLAPSPDRLLAALSKGHRADIRRAEREGVRVRAGVSGSDLETFYAIMEATGARAGFGVHSRAYYRAAWDLFRTEDTAVGERETVESPGNGAEPSDPDTQLPASRVEGEGHALLLLAERGGEALAAFLIFAWAGTGLYLYSGATEAGLKSGANHALQWRALQWAKERGAILYDFWGIPDALGQAATVEDASERARLEQLAQSDPLSGVFRFKKGFGGRIVRYAPAYDRVYIPALYTLWRRRFGN
jgi:lipid II:glycine glycyltransferase (peptidoglycan interpeptide bridge formation enzyme)